MGVRAFPIVRVTPSNAVRKRWVSCVIPLRYGSRGWVSKPKLPYLSCPAWRLETMGVLLYLLLYLLETMGVLLYLVTARSSMVAALFYIVGVPLYGRNPDRGGGD